MSAMTATRLRQRVLALERVHLAVLLRLLVGGTFIFSGVTKLPIHSEFVDVVKSYNILPHSLATAYGVTLPWVELVVGAYLVLGILTRPSAIVVLLMGISFMVANITAIVRGEDSCGSCFGDIVTFPAWQSLVVDVLIMVAALYLLILCGRKQILCFDSWFAQRQRGRSAASTNDDGGANDN